MATFRIKENSVQAKELIHFLNTLSYVEKVVEKTPNGDTLKAFKETQQNKVTRLKKGQLFEDMV